MDSKIIKGRDIAKKREERLIEKISRLVRKPKIVSILIGNDPASLLYTQMKQKKAGSLGIGFDYMNFSEDESFQNVVMTIIKLNNDPEVSGVMIQLPLPKKFLQNNTPEDLLKIINSQKDVDGLTENSPFLPAAVKAVMSILEEEKIDVKDKFIAVLGTSRLVGLPIAKELKKKGAIVSSINRETPNTEEITKRADIVISATGQGGILTGDMVKEGLVVIDVGTLVIEDQLDGVPEKKVVGDVDFELVYPKASKITPVPGGVGPVTVISLMENAVESVLSITEN